MRGRHEYRKPVPAVAKRRRTRLPGRYNGCGQARRVTHGGEINDAENWAIDLVPLNISSKPRYLQQQRGELNHAFIPARIQPVSLAPSGQRSGSTPEVAA